MLALLFGAIDMLSISGNGKAMKIALLHGGLNTLWVSAYAIIAGIQLSEFPNINIPAIVSICCKLAVVLGMTYSNFLGGELLLKYEIGINRKN